MNKKSLKKLVLNRETLQRIAVEALEQARGGTVEIGSSPEVCRTEEWSSCPPCE
jgi:hypothetical protein